MAFHNVPPNGFPDLPDVEELEAVEKDVATLKSTATSQGEAITALLTALPTKAPKSDIAPTFSADSNYAVGDLVYYEGVLYECTTEHEAAAWDAEDFTATSIDEELSVINSNLGGLHLISFTMTDTFEANSDTSNGVLLSDLTGGVITLREQVKGLAPFNTQAETVDVMQYQNKLVLKIQNAATQSRSISIPMVLFY